MRRNKNAPAVGDYPGARQPTRMIAESEKRVDEILRAARLERHEKQPMSNEQLKMILETGLIALGMILIFAFFFILFYLCR